MLPIVNVIGMRGVVKWLPAFIVNLNAGNLRGATQFQTIANRKAIFNELRMARVQGVVRGGGRLGPLIKFSFRQILQFFALQRLSPYRTL